MLNIKRLLGFTAAQARRDAEQLLDAVVRLSRRPGFFEAGRLPDSFDGRLELVMAHAAVLILRLRRDPSDSALAQEFVDVFFKYLDASLREAGVGDLTVPKRMKALAGAFYGRLKAYEAGLATADEALAAALSRNAFHADDTRYAPALADHLRSLHAALNAAPTAALQTDAFWEGLPG